jgi:hypothetical protein
MENYYLSKRSWTLVVRRRNVMEIRRNSVTLKPMSASMYIVVEGEDPGFDIFVNGHALARNEDALARLAERLSVQPLLEFFSADRNSMALRLGHGQPGPDWTDRLPEPQWYRPEDGLRTVRSLLDFLAMAPDALGRETEFVARELREYETVLRKTALRRLRWHIAVSWL